jgi:flagellar biosynthesis protein FlhG
MMGPRLTAIGSGKGGTGKTLIATSLAYLLAQSGERVLICDCDLGLSNAAIHLGLGHGGDLPGVLSGARRIDEAVVTVRGRFDLLAAPAGSGALANLNEQSGSKLIAALRKAELYDRVVLDLGAGVDATVMYFASRADETLLAMTPDPASLTDAYAFVKLMLRRCARAPDVIINMTQSEAEARRTAESLIAASKNFLKVAPLYLGRIPRDAHAADAVRRQTALPALYPDSPATKAIDAIAQGLKARRPAAQAARTV